MSTDTRTEKLDEALTSLARAIRRCSPLVIGIRSRDVADAITAGDRDGRRNFDADQIALDLLAWLHDAAEEYHDPIDNSPSTPWRVALATLADAIGEIVTRNPKS